ncbi:DUF6207 family protein [Streptomyces sp. NBC_01231]|nr:DUF6207 family protein [Streptomyces sp. NBC_01231]
MKQINDAHVAVPGLAVVEVAAAGRDRLRGPGACADPCAFSCGILLRLFLREPRRRRRVRAGHPHVRRGVGRPERGSNSSTFTPWQPRTTSPGT